VVATAERVGEHIALRVGPVPLREDDPLVNVGAGAVEAVVETRDGGSAHASGRLQHPGSVAAAVLRDLIESRRDLSPAPPIRHASPGRTGVEPTLGATA
jgi:homoserine dehydrogenase